MRLSVRIIIGFLLVIFCSLISFWINIRLSGEVTRNTQFLTNSEAIIRNSARIHKNIIEMQSGFRGFLLTGHDVFLEPYYTGMRELPSLCDEEKKLISDSPLQSKRMDSIIQINHEWIKYSTSLIKAKRKTLYLDSSSQEYRDLFENKLQKEVGKKMTDKMSLIFREFDKHEYSVRTTRRNNLTSSIKIARSVTLLLSVTTICLGVLSALFITRLITKRIKSMVNLAEKISKGQFEAIEDTQQDELTDLVTSLNIMSGKLKTSFNELDQFAYVASHDLKAPLRGMYNIAQWMDEDCGHEMSEQMKKYMEQMKGRIFRMEMLITGLLEYSRIGRVNSPVEKVNIAELLAEIADTLVPPNFTVKIGPGMPVLVTERIRIHQVFSNLISNAVKHHGGEKGAITITAQRRQQEYEFTVTDDGTGIEPEYHSKIFVMFQTLREKHETESTGIGLAIVRKIIEDKKGTIRVISDKGKGASFIFTWPIESNNE